MKILFFDCETESLPQDYKASYNEYWKWPRCISLAWLLTTDTGEILEQHHHLILPQGWKIPTEKFWVDYGFSQEESIKNGVPINDVLDIFLDTIIQADAICSHNISFDHRIVWAEHVRAGKKPRSGMPKVCTMMASTKLCQIPYPSGRKGFKFPKLQELYFHLFEKDFEGAHDALADVIACKESFFELLKRGVIELPKVEESVKTELL